MVAQTKVHSSDTKLLQDSNNVMTRIFIKVVDGPKAGFCVELDMCASWFFQDLFSNIYDVIPRWQFGGVGNYELFYPTINDKITSMTEVVQALHKHTVDSPFLLKTNFSSVENAIVNDTTVLYNNYRKANTKYQRKLALERLFNERKPYEDPDKCRIPFGYFLPKDTFATPLDNITIGVRGVFNKTNSGTARIIAYIYFQRFLNPRFKKFLETPQMARPYGQYVTSTTSKLASIKMLLDAAFFSLFYGCGYSKRKSYIFLEDDESIALLKKVAVEYLGMIRAMFASHRSVAVKRVIKRLENIFRNIKSDTCATIAVFKSSPEAFSSFDNYMLSNPKVKITSFKQETNFEDVMNGNLSEANKIFYAPDNITPKCRVSGYTRLIVTQTPDIQKNIRIGWRTLLRM